MMSAEGPPATQPDMGDLQQQIADMKALVQLQLQSMTMQTQILNTVSSSNSALAINHVKHVKVGIILVGLIITHLRICSDLLRNLKCLIIQLSLA